MPPRHPQIAHNPPPCRVDPVAVDAQQLIVRGSPRSRIVPNRYPLVACFRRVGLFPGCRGAAGRVGIGFLFVPRVLFLARHRFRRWWGKFLGQDFLRYLLVLSDFLQALDRLVVVEPIPLHTDDDPGLDADLHFPLIRLITIGAGDRNPRLSPRQEDFNVLACADQIGMAVVIADAGADRSRQGQLCELIDGPPLACAREQWS